MFEDLCLQCGKPLQDDGSAYCSDECQSIDLASPSISSSSSALSSPSLGFAHGGDVPPLVPSVLGSALHKCQARDPYYVSSSSASSNSWTLATDDEENEGVFVARGLGYRDGTDSIYDGSSKSANFVYSLKSSALSYARRPSGTNNHSIVPQVHQRGSSPGPNTDRVRGEPRSVPSASRSSSADEEGDLSDYSLSSREDSEADSLKSKARKNRNRGSLPTYFNLLQINSPSTKEAAKSSPVLSSSNNTIARPSPPTPKNVLLSPFPIPRPVAAQDTPRGRRRNDVEPSHCFEDSSASRSRSRAESRGVPSGLRSRREGKPGLENAFDQTSDDIPRGRSTVRRNSSPIPRMFITAAVRDTDRSQSSQTGGRGRVRVADLEGVGCLPEAPGFGNGRSGLLDRGRMATLAKRVPL